MIYPTYRLPIAMCGLAAVVLATGFQQQGVRANEAAAVDFAHDIVPILKRNCIHCHGGREEEGGFSWNDRSLVLDSGYVDLDDPESSYLLELMTSTDPDLQMPPPDRPRATEKEITLVRRWIQDGLTWEPGFTFRLDTYQPPLRPRTHPLPPPRDGRNHPIDRILDDYLAGRNLPRPEPIDDAVFLRRVSLDLIGLLPTSQQLQRFLADVDPEKRERFVDELLSNTVSYADHWMTFFNDLLRNDYSGTGFITRGRTQITEWLYQSLSENKPFDQMTRELISPPEKDSEGFINGIKWRGEVSAGQTLPIQFSQSVSQSFLGINMKCASCHDSFVDHWTLKDAYGLAAIYADESLELHRCDKPTGETAQAAWLFPELGQVDPNAKRKDRLDQLAGLMTHRENGRFARTIVNRIWHQMMGRGIVFPLDAMQSEPWSEELLDFLANDFVESDYDMHSLLRLIASSQAYQSVSELRDKQPSYTDQYTYRGPVAKRMTAEQFVDSIWQLTGNAPARIDAPLYRWVSHDNADKNQIKRDSPIEGRWIWGSSEDSATSKATSKATSGAKGPSDQTLVLRKTMELSDTTVLAAVLIACEDPFELFVNDLSVTQSGSGKEASFVQVTHELKKGTNSLHFVVKRDAAVASPAGLFVQGSVLLHNGTQLDLVSDASWQCSNDAPKIKGKRLLDAGSDWKQARVVPVQPAWQKMIDNQGRELIAGLATRLEDVPKPRASLLKNTPLMKSLGRPMREQIVSMRPDTVTTLEAIDLANEATLAESFAIGATKLVQQTGGDTDAIIDWIFWSALARTPTKIEYETLRKALGETPDSSAVQDVMWAVCMLPEYFVIR